MIGPEESDGSEAPDKGLAHPAATSRGSIAATDTRLALVGAFRFPFPQGSQAFLGEQARALANAGTRIEIFSYGAGEASQAGFSKGAASDSLAGGDRRIDARAIDARLAPRSARSGPSLRKPLADLALARLLALAVRDCEPNAVLAHNAEAVWVARAARAQGVRVPIVYVAHTLWEHEASSYASRAGASKRREAQLPARRAAGGGGKVRSKAEERWAGFGRWIDRSAARASDAVVTLTECARTALAPHASGPVLCIAPGLERREPPTRRLCDEICARHGLEPLRFALYSGNVDAYQNLEGLASTRAGIPIVVATYDPAGAPPAVLANRRVRVVVLESEREARALRFAAGLHVVPRQRPGGFPIKLLNAMESGRPIVASAALAETLEHERSAWLLGENSSPQLWAEAIERLSRDAELASRLAQGALAALAAHHDWNDAARRTLELVRSLH